MTTLGKSIAKELLIPGSCWQLQICLNCFLNEASDELVTQAAAGRCFQFIEEGSLNLLVQPSSRIKVKLLEDGYICWIDFSVVLGNAFQCDQWKPISLTAEAITSRLPKILDWVEKAASRPNKYLWGGTLGPDFDCSGLVQSAFASQEIWLPRDAYQQETFCTHIPCVAENMSALIPGDLLFFGEFDSCKHVGIYKGESNYWHSSGKDNGHNGIFYDSLDPRDLNPVASHYRKQFRGAGRVQACHVGTTLL